MSTRYEKVIAEQDLIRRNIKYNEQLKAAYEAQLKALKKSTNSIAHPTLKESNKMSKLDEILPPEMRAVHSPEGLAVDKDLNDSKRRAVKDLFLELIGEDEPYHGDHEDQCDQESRNELRAELRKKVEEL